MPADWQRAGFGLYVHWPFCLSKCPYCDFNSHVASHIDQAAFIRAYEAEIETFSTLTGPRTLTSIFFGGGTPSLMAPATVEAVLTAARRAWSFANDVEITLEANPTSVEAAAFDGFHAAGVNRVSIGLQALNDHDLSALGRLHTVDEALRALDTARNRFSRISCDLIYARQGQTPEDWEAELDRALALGTDHLSLYQLTIEDGTAFGDRHRRGLLRGLPDEDRAVTLWEITRERTATAGMPAYEVSNHAKPGQESRHNLIYWRGGDWVGIGPGAHGRLTIDGTRIATEAERAPGAWLAAVAAGGGHRREVLAPADRAAEYLMMSLRLSEGSDLDRFAVLGGAIDGTRIADLAAQGLMTQTGSRLATTDAGRLLLNSVLAALLA